MSEAGVNENDIEIGPYRPGDEPEIVRVYNLVFRQNRTVEAWRWAFQDNPAGTHCFVARLPSGRILSQFTGIPRKVRLRDRTVCFAEIVDSFTDPEFRQGLKKPGIFASTCYAFVDHFGRPDREIVMYGLPNPPAFRVGRALLGYVHLYDVQLLTAPSLPPPRDESGLEDGGRCARVDRYSADADAFEARAGAVHEALVVRDAAYLNWRYAARPDLGYSKVEFRDAGGGLFGLAALRHGWLDGSTCGAAELFFDRHHPLVPAAVRRILEIAGAAGDRRVQVFARPGSPEWNGLAQHGFIPEPSHFRFVARTYDREAVPLDWLKDAWYVSLGDFDVI